MEITDGRGMILIRLNFTELHSPAVTLGATTT
jgi:hypothetical protein